MNILDLHIHSTMSDGKHNIKDLFLIAKQNNLQILSITDHDTVDGIEEAVNMATEFNIRIIPGAEISVESEDKTRIHILGYGINHKNKQLLECFRECQIRREEKAKKMLAHVQELGFIVEWSDVTKLISGNSITTPHVAKAVLSKQENKKQLNKIVHYGDFINTYFQDQTRYETHKNTLRIKDAIDLIHRAKGVAIWAHPILSFPNAYEQLELFLQKLLKWGIDGLEVINSSAHTQNDMNFLEKLTKKYNLLRTAGSDFHEHEIHPANDRGLHFADTIGDYNSHGISTEEIVPLLDKAITNLII